MCCISFLSWLFGSFGSSQKNIKNKYSLSNPPPCLNFLILFLSREKVRKKRLLNWLVLYFLCLNSYKYFMYFFLDKKVPKNQGESDIQHRFATRSRYAGQALIKLLYYCDFSIWALMSDSNFLNYCCFTGFVPATTVYLKEKVPKSSSTANNCSLIN